MSGFLGAVIPMCECGIIPVTRRLLRKGLPLSCCVTYILAGPIVNVVVLLTTYVAFAAPQASAIPTAGAAPGTPHFEIRDRLIELDDLRRRGILSEEEFAAKKSELLNRI